MKKFFLIPCIFLFLIFSFVGCARWNNDTAARGGIIGNYTGDYIIRNDSFGKIMDLWKLKNVYYSPTDKLFRDQKGNVIMLGSNVLAIRVVDLETWNLYHEYHCEFETKSYQELYAKP
jgi:hypothetical protein